MNFIYLDLIFEHRVVDALMDALSFGTLFPPPSPAADRYGRSNDPKKTKATQLGQKK